MKKTVLATSLLALVSVTACASSAAPAAQEAAGEGWMVVADAPAVAGSHEQPGISRQPVMTQGGVMMGGGYVGPLSEPAAKEVEKYNALRIRVVGYGAPPANRSTRCPSGVSSSPPPSSVARA